ncbi:MAG: STAS domain-containing protein [Planctomycetaceae bacterium]|nr:STAS domain-containing protein [Planctomycetaceae bacterium]
MSDLRHISINVVNDICVVHLLDNRIVDDMNIYELGTELFALVEQNGYEKILLNFSNVGFLSSAALGKLIMLYKKVAVRSGVLKLCNITPDIRELFTMMNLDRIFTICSNEADALATF